ncbi:MAG TPA: SDR family oxidoreductase [Burkholderiales bacterium]|jgi:NAD(P)-dependent dehydrogenase (short-subunit alcohol dehydrogenase family)|nr:SDR family oxidoreductase [Burkholderiales bacterium]
MLLRNDTALVTGAAQGIGKAIAAALEADGAKVFAVDREFDLSLPGTSKALTEKAIQALGQVSIFVHAASPPRKETQTALAVTEAEWREMLEVQLNSGFLIAQALGRHMRGKKIRGRMLFVTSLHSYSPRNLPHYSASKAGQTMVVKELARALGPDGIRVNALVPGAFPGAGFKGSPGLVERIPMKRLGKPEDIAPMAVAILSEKYGSYMTGASVVVDGGIALYNWLDASG